MGVWLFDMLAYILKLIESKHPGDDTFRCPGTHRKDV